MSNGNHQLETLISEATRRVANDGRDACQSDLLLAVAGYLSYQIQKPQWHSLRRIVPIAFGGGGVVMVVIIGILMRWLGV